jgi:hypothetical protein
VQAIQSDLYHLWIHQHGGILNAQTVVLGAKLGVGVIARDTLRPGDLIASIPQSLAVGADVFDLPAKIVKALDVHDDSPEAERKRNFAKLAVQVLRRWADPQFRPWFNSWPRVVHDIPSAWTEEELQVLHAASPLIAKQARQRKAWCTAAFAELHPHLKSFVPEDVLSEGLWQWICAMMHSRSVNSLVGSRDWTLLPLDKFNHQLNGETVHFDAAQGVYQVRASKRYLKGQSIFLRYYRRPKTVEAPFLNHGIVLDEDYGRTAFHFEFEPPVNDRPKWGRLKYRINQADRSWQDLVISTNVTLLMRIFRLISADDDELRERLADLMACRKGKDKTEGLAILRAMGQLHHIQSTFREQDEKFEGLSPTVAHTMARELMQLQGTIVEFTLMELEVRLGALNGVRQPQFPSARSRHKKH